MVNGTKPWHLPESERVARIRDLQRLCENAFLAVSKAIVELHKLDCPAYIYYEPQGTEGGVISLRAPLDRTLIHSPPATEQ